MGVRGLGRGMDVRREGGDVMTLVPILRLARGDKGDCGCASDGPVCSPSSVSEGANRVEISAMEDWYPSESTANQLRPPFENALFSPRVASA